MSKIPVMSQTEVNRALSAVPEAEKHQALRIKIIDMVLAYHPETDTPELLAKADALFAWATGGKAANVDINVVEG